MKRQNGLSAPLLAAIGAAVLVVLLFLSYLLSSGVLHQKGIDISLNSSTENAPEISAGSQMLTAQSVADVTIGTENAQRVIASLTRPEAYSCTIENTLYYDGGSSVFRCRRYLRGNIVRTDVVNETGVVQSTLVRADDAAYAWDAGSTTVYQGAWGDFSDDAAAMLPTYEDVLGEDVVLSEAGRRDIDNEPCITATFSQGGYRCVYSVSAASGLLKEASFYTGETLVRQVKIRDFRNETPDDALFLLPDGQKLLGDETDDDE